eukprot:17116-Prymnesium_polylepis.1
MFDPHGALGVRNTSSPEWYGRHNYDVVTEQLGGIVRIRATPQTARTAYRQQPQRSATSCVASPHWAPAMLTALAPSCQSFPH